MTKSIEICLAAGLCPDPLGELMRFPRAHRGPTSKAERGEMGRKAGKGGEGRLASHTILAPDRRWKCHIGSTPTSFPTTTYSWVRSPHGICRRRTKTHFTTQRSQKTEHDRTTFHITLNCWYCLDSMRCAAVQQGLCNGRVSVRPSVRVSHHSPNRPARNTDRLPQSLGKKSKLFALSLKHFMTAKNRDQLRNTMGSVIEYGLPLLFSLF